MKSWLWLRLVLGASAVLAGRVPSDISQAAREVMATQEARTSALDHSDVAALERIMADDVTYIHASGKVDTKKSYLEAIRSGQLHYFHGNLRTCKYAYWEIERLSTESMRCG
jgi:Domain of unknown function (DUF4440)